MSSFERKLLMKSLGSSLPPMPPPGGSSASKKRKGPPGRRKDYSLLQWSDYFTSSQDVKVDEDNIFRIYECGSEGPLVFLIHGGGFSGLTWAVLSATLTKLVKCRTVAMDVRGHGNTKTTDEDDLSAERLASDIGNVICTLYKDTDVPPTILVGHSMGGAISIHSAIKNLVPSLVGMIVIDVVEGTALEALHSMQSFLKGRPSHFKSIEYAIEWVNRTGQIRNLESARVSMIGQLREMEEHEVPQNIKEREIEDAANTIAEEDEEDGETSSESKAKAINKEKPNQYYTWRIDLSKTESFWKGVDRLDKDLAVGQMQGKFQMQVIGNCGHTMHEDQPQKVAEAIATFLLRHKMAESLSGFESLNFLSGCRQSLRHQMIVELNPFVRVAGDMNEVAKGHFPVAEVTIGRMAIYYDAMQCPFKTSSILFVFSLYDRKDTTYL